MNKLIKKELNTAIEEEAKKLLEDENLENRLDELDELYILRRTLRNYEELKPMLSEFFRKKDKEEKER